jgi:hypothetical protein
MISMRDTTETPSSAWIGVLLLTFILAIGLLGATPSPQDDHYLYQQFAESLAAGKPDFSIPGFHGTDWLGTIVFLVTKSPIAQIHGLLIAALLLPLLGFVAGKSLYKDEFMGLLLAGIVTMMPFISFVLFRGWTGPGYWMLMLLTVIGATRKSWWTGIPWALAILTKPFAIVLLPLIVVFSGKQTEHFWAKLNPATWFTHKRKYPAPWITSLLIVVLLVGAYLVAQYVKAGRIFVGAHDGLTPMTAIQGPVRVILNLAHSLQILFSVHNYYFVDPSLTGPGNMLHTTPLLMFLGVFALLSPSKYFRDRGLPMALLLGAVAGLVLNAFLDHMDHFYMEASVLLLILAALPVLKAHKGWIPLVLLTLHFQWFYFWLQYQSGFGLTWMFWVVPLAVDLCYATWAGYSYARENGAA